MLKSDDFDEVEIGRIEKALITEQKVGIGEMILLILRYSVVVNEKLDEICSSTQE